MQRAASKELVALGRRVGEWRKLGGGKGSRIPEELWNAAVEVSRIDGLYATAKALRFEYMRLKARRDGAARRSTPTGGAATEPAAIAVVGGDAGSGSMRLPGRGRSRFVTLDMALSPPATGQTVVELVRQDGERMRVEMTGGVDLVALARTFWSREP